MLSGFAQRIGSPWAVVGLGLATPLLAVGALVLANSGGSDHEVVTASSGRAPTPMPLGPTTTGVTRLTPGGEPVKITGADASSGDSKGGSKSSTSDSNSYKSSNSSSSKSSSYRKSSDSTFSKSSSSKKSSKSSTTTKSSGASKSSSSGYSGSTGGVTTTTRRASSTTGGGSGDGGGGGGGTSTTQPPSTTIPPHVPIVLLADFMGYSGDLTSSYFGDWSVVSTGGGSVTGNGDAVDLDAAPGDRALAVVGGPYDDLDLTVDVTSLSQGGGQDTAWVVWHYTAPDSFLALYLGADGWGIVSVTSGGVQVLDSGSNNPLGVLGTATVRVLQVGDLIFAWADGVSLGDANAAYQPATSGAVGVAASGSIARFDNLVVRTT